MSVAFELSAEQKKLTDTAYAEALSCLRENANAKGFVASPERHANYYSIWSRDHCICTIAAYLSGEKDLMETGRAGVEQLLRNQLDNGQVPSYIEIESGKAVYGGFGRITTIDSNLWVMIAVALMFHDTKNPEWITTRRLLQYSNIYTLLRSADLDRCGLIEVPVSGDWADIMDRSYHVLYDEVLYFEALHSLCYIFTEAIESRSIKYKDAKEIQQKIVFIKKRLHLVRNRINESFWFTKENIPHIIDDYMIHNQVTVKDYPYYQSHLMPFKQTWAHRIDTFGNVLAALSTVAPKQRTLQVIRYILSNKINEPLALRALWPIISEGDMDWITIYEKKEAPHTYHNGGIWPMITGFWIASLVRNGQTEVAKKEILKFAEYLEKTGWIFPEHIHGETLEPLGRKKQAWSAAGYIIAWQALFNKKTIFQSLTRKQKKWVPHERNK